MQKATKPETSRSMSSVPFHQSPSLVSLPMLPRPSTSAMGSSSLALSGSQLDNLKRPRVNSKAGTLGSLFRAKAHSKRSSNAGSDSMSPLLEPQDGLEGAWGVGIDYPVATSPLFSDESLQQFLGSSPQLTSQSPGQPSSPVLSGSPALPDPAHSPNGPMSPMSASSRRSKREIAASVLHNSAGPFRRLRSGPASKTLSFPPAVSSESSIYNNVASDEFVVVTSDMCPPAALVGSSVISGVSPAEPTGPEVAGSAVASSSSSSTVSVVDVNAVRSKSSRSAMPHRNPARAHGSMALRARALTQVSKSSEHLLLMRSGIYEDSMDSLVRVSTPSLSASSSEASLLLSQAPPGSNSRGHKKVPAPLAPWSLSRNQNGAQALPNSALGPAFKPPLPRNAHMLSPSPQAFAGSPRKASECSFSSTEDQRHLSPFVQLDTLSPYTVSRLNKTAAKASERRRRSSVRRPRTPSTTSSANWGLSATSDVTLLAGSARSHHTRMPSDTSEYGCSSARHYRHGGQTFDFQVQSAVEDSFWQQDESPLLSDEELEHQIAASGFPSSSSSAQFNFEVGRDIESTGESPPQLEEQHQQHQQHQQQQQQRRASESENADARSADEVALARHRVFPRGPHNVMALLDPSSPTHESSERSMALNMLARPRRPRGRAHTSAVPEALPEYDDDDNGDGAYNDGLTGSPPLSPTIPDQFDFDGSTLTQQSDWQLMNASSSDGEQPPEQHSIPRRRVRKRRVLPKTMFQVPAKNIVVAGLANGDVLCRASRSSDTLRAGTDDPAVTSSQSEVTVIASKHDTAGSAISIVASADATVAPATTDAVEAATAAVEATPEMQKMLDLEVIPRTPLSIQQHFRIEHVAHLRLVCSGDAGDWQGARIPGFDLRLAACIGRAHGLRELELVNIGLASISRSLLGCQGLRRLNLAHNWIGAVPSWLSRLGALQHIVLSGNPLRTVSAEIVEMRERLLTLDLGDANRWALLSRAPTVPRLTADERKQVLLTRLQDVASQRMAAYVKAARLNATRRQHEAALERATRLLTLYSNTLYSASREPRNWGHSVALPLPAAHRALF